MLESLEAKYCIPRSPTLKTCYRSNKLQRPKMKVHGVWMFGYVLRIAVVEESTFHGSSMVHELISLTLEDTIEVCREKGVSAPDTLVIVGDNTVKELKNKVCLSGVANYINHSHLKHLDANVKQKVLNFFPTLIWLSTTPLALLPDQLLLN